MVLYGGPCDDNVWKSRTSAQDRGSYISGLLTAYAGREPAQPMCLLLLLPMLRMCLLRYRCAFSTALRRLPPTTHHALQWTALLGPTGCWVAVPVNIQLRGGDLAPGLTWL